MRSGTVVVLASIIVMQAFLVRNSPENVQNSNVPIFRVLNPRSTYVPGGVDIEFTCKNVGYPATTNTIWIAWEKVAFNVPLTGGFRRGNITEATLGLDINGDSDTDDIFNVRYVNNTQVEIDGKRANSTSMPEQTRLIEGGNLFVYDERNSFALGTKNHTLFSVWSIEDNYFATIGADVFFQSHPTPHAVFFVEQRGSSIDSIPTAEITSIKLNGTSKPCDFQKIVPWFLPIDEGRWYTENVYIYPFGFVDSNTIFTVQLCIRGEPGSYILTTMLNWSPDTFHLYQYVLSAVSEIPFGITGTVQREVNVEGETYPIYFLTNSTVSDTVVLDQAEKTLSFNVTGHYGGVGMFNVTLPLNLFGNNPLSITVDGAPLTDFVQTKNQTHTSLRFNINYPPSPITAFTTSNVIIKAAEAQPLWTQWWLWTAVVSIVILTMTAFILQKRRRAQKETTASLEVSTSR